MGLRSLPITFPSVMGVFAPVFSRPGWQPVQGLMRGAILAPGQRTVTAMRQRMGRRAAPAWQTYHRDLHRAVGSPRKARRRLRRRLGAVFLPRGVVILGLEDTIERRRGAPIAAQGISRAPVRSSHAPVVNVRGLRWLACLGLTPLAGADRVWARPGLTGLGPAERCAAQRGRRHQTVTARAWQRIRRGGRGRPGRAGALVADSRCAALELRDKVATWPRARVRTRRRLDAALSAPPPPRQPRPPDRPRLTGKCRPTLAATWAEERTPGTMVLVDPWDGDGPREVEVATAGGKMSSNKRHVKSLKPSNRPAILPSYVSRGQYSKKLS